MRSYFETPPGLLAALSAHIVAEKGDANERLTMGRWAGNVFLGGCICPKAESSGLNVNVVALL